MKSHRQKRTPVSPLIFLLLTLLTTATPTQAAEKTPIALSTHKQRPNPLLLAAYQHWQNHAFEAAGKAYEKLLESEPDNLDALLALATLADLQGRPEAAGILRAKAQLADPLDIRVQAALLNRPTRDLANQESRLKSLLAQHPEAAPLHFALGNHHARQKNWPEAQAAYFKAVASDPDNPDYLFNLAVSLDHLGQSSLAQAHYQRSQEAARQRPAAYSTASLTQRLLELAP